MFAAGKCGVMLRVACVVGRMLAAPSSIGVRAPWAVIPSFDRPNGWGMPFASKAGPAFVPGAPAFLALIPMEKLSALRRNEVFRISK